MFEQIRTYYQNLTSINDEEWVELEKRLVKKTLRKGEFLIKEGEVCSHVSFINAGLLKMYYLVDGKEINVDFVHEDQYISDYQSFLTREPAALNIEAMEDSELLLLGYGDMQYLYDRFPAFERFGRRIAEHLFIMLSSKNTSLLAQSPEENYLRMMADEQNILQRVPQYMIASYLGITPEHLSRIRRKLVP